MKMFAFNTLDTYFIIWVWNQTENNQSLLLTEMPRPNSILLCDCRLWLSSLLRRFLLLLPCEGLQIHLSVWSENVKSSASPPSMLRMPPVVAILALDSSVVEPILMHLSPSRATIMQPRPSSREMIMRARHAWTWAAHRNKHNGLENKTFYIKKGRYSKNIIPLSWKRNAKVTSRSDAHLLHMQGHRSFKLIRKRNVCLW